MTAGAEQPSTPARAPALDRSGLLRLDKPIGMTSHDVVDRVRRRLGLRGVGHLGTLDPGASGLLVLALGAATRCATIWQGGEKTYEATVRFGIETDTQDLEGRVLAERPVAFDEARLREASLAFVGDLQQVPPMVSALKHRGERLYEIARRGETIERAARSIHVVAWEWRAVALPEATCRIRCSGGTYVRTLAHDLGAALGSGAAIASLRRLRSEPFEVEGALTIAELDVPAFDVVRSSAYVPLDRALETLPAIVLGEAAVARIARGNQAPLDRDAVGAASLAGGARSIVMRDTAGRALALGELIADPAGADRVLARPHLVFPWAVREGRPQ